jgi:hypothetical protein
VHTSSNEEPSPCSGQQNYSQRRIAFVPALDKMYFGQAFAVDPQYFRNLSLEMNRQYYRRTGAPFHHQEDVFGGLGVEAGKQNQEEDEPSHRWIVPIETPG